MAALQTGTMRVLAIDTALEACSAAVLDTDAAAIIASEIAERWRAATPKR